MLRCAPMGAAPGRGAPSGLGASEHRVLNPRPFRVFRRTYSTAEPKAGAAVLLGLALLWAWVAWRGAHPEPALSADPALLETAAAAVPAEIEGRSAPEGVSREAAFGPVAASFRGSPRKAGARGPSPASARTTST